MQFFRKLITNLNQKYQTISPLSKEIINIIILLVISIFTYKTLILAPATSVLGDGPRYNGYFAMKMVDSLEKYGQLGFWDPLVSSGMSLISYSSGAHFSPLAWISVFLFKELSLAANFMELIYVSLAVIFFYILLRAVGISRLTAVLITVPYIANQYPFIYIANGWFEELMGTFLLPATIGLYWLAIAKKSYTYSIFGGLIMSLHFFDNSYYVFHYNVIALLWVSLVLGIRTVVKKGDSAIKTNSFWEFIRISLVFGGVFLGISAVKLIPLYEFYKLSARNSLTLVAAELEAQEFSVLYDRIKYFFIPSSFSNSLLFSFANYGVILCSLIGLFYAFFKRKVVYIVFFTLFFIGCWGYLANKAFPDLYAFFYNFLPGFSSNRLPYRFFVVIHFAYALCIALGLNLLLVHKNRLVKILGVFLGVSLTITSILYILQVFSLERIYLTPDFKKALSSTKVEINISEELVPEVRTKDQNLLAILTNVVSKYKNDTRVSLISNNVSNKEIFESGIETITHPYDKTTLTYKYHYTRPASEKDDLETTMNRYKMFSILNTRFHMQESRFSEFAGCRGMEIPNNLESLRSISPALCEYLKTRLTPIIFNKNGGIYFDTNVLPRVSLISGHILLVSDNRFNDFSGFIAKKLIFHPDFDEKKISVLSSDKNLEDYKIDDFKNISAIVLVDPKITDETKFNSLKKDYKKSGGQIIELSSKWINYDSLHDRSSSIWTDRPAWNYSKEDEKKLSDLFKKFQKANPGRVKIAKYTPEDITFKVNSVNNSVLQFSDTYYPGWKAEIDGKPTRLYMADGVVKGVVVPSGEYTVRMYYSPESFKIGALISASTLIALLVLLLKKIRKKMIRSITVVLDIIKGMLFDGSYRSDLLDKFKKKMSFSGLLIKIKKQKKNYVFFVVLLFVVVLFYPLFLNNTASAGDLPFYWSGYLRDLLFPQVWNSHWPTGLGGNQAIILPLKLYVQLLIPLSLKLGLSWDLLQKISFFLTFIVLALGSSYLLIRSWIGSLIYTTNTWILMVFLGGQTGVALSYAIIPLILFFFKKVGKDINLRSSLIFGLVYSLQILFDQRIALITLGIILILLIFNFLQKGIVVFSKIKKKLLMVLVVALELIVLNAFWILPILFSTTIGAGVFQVISGERGQLSFFSFAFAENTISLLHPNWPENIFGKVYFMRPEFLILPIILFSSLLFTKSKKYLEIVPFLFLGFLGAFLAKGTNDPFGSFYSWLFQNIPGFNLFRDPTKFYILIALAYSVSIPFVLENLSHKLSLLIKKILRINMGIFSSEILLSILFIVFWSFTLYPAFANKVKGLSNQGTLPVEYVEFKDYLESQPEFFRTLWFPSRQRFGYFSDNHPAIDGYDLFGRISESSMAAKLKEDKTLKLLSNLSIKYIVVPYDSRGEIFLNDRKYDDKAYRKLIERLNKNINLTTSVRFGKIQAYQMPSQQGHFYSVRSGEVLNNVKSLKAGRSKYYLDVKDAKSGDLLIFSEGYDLGWEILYDALKIYPIQYKGLINGFVLPKDGDYSLLLNYKIQKYGNIGNIISVFGLVIVVSTIYISKKNK